MPDAVKTTVTELPESRVRVEAEVPAAEVERRMQATARQMGRDLRAYCYLSKRMNCSITASISFSGTGFWT